MRSPTHVLETNAADLMLPVVPSVVLMLLTIIAFMDDTNAARQGYCSHPRVAIKVRSGYR